MNDKSMSLLLERLILEGRVFIFNFNVECFIAYATSKGYSITEDARVRVDNSLLGKYYTFC